MTTPGLDRLGQGKSRGGGQGRAGQEQEQGRAGQGRAGAGAGPEQAGQGRAGQGWADGAGQVVFTLA